MGIYIKGMEMPEFGEKIIILTSSGYVEDVSGQVIDGVEAVHVQAHGKLIDADKLIKRLQKQLNEAQAKVRAMGELNIGYTPDMYIMDRNRDMISTLIAQAAFLPKEIEK